MVQVSVVMPVWNRQAYVAAAIESVLAQTFRDFELIVIDDGSSDDSPRICTELARRDVRIRFIQQENAGCYATRNHGLELSHGKYTAIVDSDDTITPKRLQTQVEYLDANPDCVAVGSAVTFTDPYGIPNRVHTPPLDHQAIDDYHMQVGPGAMIHGATTCRTQALHQLGGYRTTPTGADYDLFLRLAEIGKLANLAEPMLNVRMHLNSLTGQRRDNQIAMAHRYQVEALARRGLPQPSEPIGESSATSGKILTAAQQARSWALHAIEARNLPIARRHAWMALRHDPWKLESWRILRWAMTG